jgi:5-formyltetrahydrofolate cyclo-ligase
MFTPPGTVVFLLSGLDLPMMNDPQDALKQQKSQLRDQAHAARNVQPNKDELSQEICAKFMALPEYGLASTVLYYIDVRSEVRTRHALPAALAQGKKIVVPWCNVQGELELFHLESMEELAVGMYRILEPKQELRDIASKKVQAQELDLVMVPGVAFDRSGARMGHGKGYYDKLLQHARLDAPLVALAFECQLFAAIPTAAHDIFMDRIITEKAIYQGKGRAGSSS